MVTDFISQELQAGINFAADIIRILQRIARWRILAQTRALKLIGAHISAMPELDPAPGRWTYRQEGLLFLELLRTGRLKVDDLITWRARPEECNAVYEVIAKGGKDHVGILLEWKTGAPPP